MCAVSESSVDCHVSSAYTSKSDESRDVSRADGCSPLMSESQPLTLTLEAVMASQLVQMFGPSGTGLAVHFVLLHLQ